MNLPKLTIQKKVVLSSSGHFRFYSADFDPSVIVPGYRGYKMPKRKALMIDLADYPEIRTEKQLCRFMYNNWGSGEYMVLGHVKGRSGLWVFWRGDINDQGFVFKRKDRINVKEVNKLEQEKSMSEDEEEKQFLQDMIDSEKEFATDGKVRYGFYPYLKPSERRGIMAFWNDGDLNVPQDSSTSLDTWGIKEEPIKRDILNYKKQAIGFDKEVNRHNFNNDIEPKDDNESYEKVSEDVWN